MNLLANKNMFEKIQHVSFHNIISLKNDMKRNRFLATLAVLATQELLTLSLLGSSSRTLTVPMNQRSFKASRRVRTTLIQHVTLEGEGGPAGSHALHRLGLPLRSAKHAVSRWRRKPCRNVLNPLSQPARVPALPVRVGVVPSSHTTKSLTGGVLSTCVPAWGC